MSQGEESKILTWEKMSDSLLPMSQGHIVAYARGLEARFKRPFGAPF